MNNEHITMIENWNKKTFQKQRKCPSVSKTLHQPGHVSGWNGNEMDISCPHLVVRNRELEDLLLTRVTFRSLLSWHVIICPSHVIRCLSKRAEGSPDPSWSKSAGLLNGLRFISKSLSVCLSLSMPEDRGGPVVWCLKGLSEAVSWFGSPGKCQPLSVVTVWEWATPWTVGQPIKGSHKQTTSQTLTLTLGFSHTTF